MKVVLSLVLMNLIIFSYSVPVYANGERVKSIYEKSQKLKKYLRYLEQNEQILSHDEEISNNPSNEIPPLNQTEIPTDDIPPAAEDMVVNTDTKPTQDVQLLTYANFNSEKTSQESAESTIAITYNILVYYHNRVAAEVITITIRVYVRVLKTGRNLQEEEYELVPEDVETNCTLNGEKISEGTCSYDCSGNTKTKAAEVTHAKVNTKEDMKLDGEPMKSEEMAVTPTAKVNGDDLISNNVIIDTKAKILDLSGGRLTNQIGNTFSIEGNIDDFNHKPGDAFDFTFIHINDKTNKKIECKVADPIQKVNDKTSKVIFNCGPYTEFLNSTLDYVYGTYKGTPADTITLNIDDGSERAILLNAPANSTQEINYQSHYRKNSSGLSGGAIAGIIIACAAALVIASALVMCLRKKGPVEEKRSLSNLGLRNPENSESNF